MLVVGSEIVFWGVRLHRVVILVQVYSTRLMALLDHFLISKSKSVGFGKRCNQHMVRGESSGAGCKGVMVVF